MADLLADIAAAALILAGAVVFHAKWQGIKRRYLNSR
jgi:hypothetical protein